MIEVEGRLLSSKPLGCHTKMNLTSELQMTMGITIQPYPREDLLRFANFLMHILEDEQIDFIEVMYGWFWGNKIFNWEHREVPVLKLLGEVADIENRGIGKIGDDDLFIWYRQADLEVQLCHEADIHILYSDHLPIVTKIIEYLIDAFPQVAHNSSDNISPVYLFPYPAFINSVELTNNGTSPVELLFEPWGNRLVLQSDRSFTIMGYASQAGLLGVHASEDGVIVRGWSSSELRVLEDGKPLYTTID